MSFSLAMYMQCERTPSTTGIDADFASDGGARRQSGAHLPRPRRCFAPASSVPMQPIVDFDYDQRPAAASPGTDSRRRSLENSSPEEIIMEANIREFGHRISMICALEAGGKISAKEAYKRIKQHYKELKASKKNLLDAPDNQL